MKFQLRLLWDELKGFIGELRKENITAVAGQGAFFMVLTLFPMAMLVLSLLRGLQIPVSAIQPALDKVLNRRAAEYIAALLRDAAQGAAGISAVSMVLVLWTASQGIYIVSQGLESAGGKTIPGGVVYKRLRAVGLTVVFLLALVIPVVAVAAGDVIKELFLTKAGTLSGTAAVLFGLRYVLFYSYLMLLFALLYQHFCGGRLRRQLPGALFCSTGWLLLSVGISAYTELMGGFSVYGSLMSLAMIMIWIYSCLLLLLVGAALNARLPEKWDRPVFAAKHPVWSGNP